MERYSDFPTECGSTHSLKGASAIPEQRLEPTEAPLSSSSTTGKGLAILSTSVMAMLLLFSLSTVLWGTVKLSQSIAQLTQIAVQEAMYSTLK